MVNEFTLDLLGEWYADKFRKNYTEKVETRARSLLKEKIGGDGIGLLFLLYSTGTLTKQGQEEGAKDFFRGTYAELENIINHVNDYFPEAGLRNEYFDPLQVEFKRLQVFVERVNKLAENKGVGDVTFKDIDSEFFSVYDDVSVFFEFFHQYLKVIDYLTDMERQDISFSLREKQVTFSEALYQVQLQVHQSIFPKN